MKTIALIASFACMFAFGATYANAGVTCNTIGQFTNCWNTPSPTRPNGSVTCTRTGNFTNCW